MFKMKEEYKIGIIEIDKQHERLPSSSIVEKDMLIGKE